MKVLLVGAGGMGGVHFRNYRRIGGADVQALVGRTDTDRAVAAEWALPLYGTISEAVRRERVDIADLCVPTYLHAPLALEAFENGLSVITEKPCALKKKDAQAMYDAADRAGKQLYVAQVVRFTRETEILRTVLADQRYGRPLDGVFRRLSARPAWSQGSWLMDEEKSGLLPYDLHIHDLDLIVSLFGKPERFRISAMGENAGLRDHFRIEYAFEGGPTVCAEAAWYNACIPFTADWRVYFEKGMLVCDSRGVTGYGADGKKTEFDTEDAMKVVCGVNLPPNGWFYRELSHFLDCAEKNIPSPAVPREEVLTVMGILEEISAAKA